MMESMWESFTLIDHKLRYGVDFRATNLIARLDCGKVSNRRNLGSDNN